MTFNGEGAVRRARPGLSSPAGVIAASLTRHESAVQARSARALSACTRHRAAPGERDLALDHGGQGMQSERDSVCLPRPTSSSAHRHEEQADRGA